MSDILHRFAHENEVNFFLLTEGTAPDFTKKAGFEKKISDFAKTRAEGLFDNLDGVKKAHKALINSATNAADIQMLRDDLKSDLPGLKKLSKKTTDKEADDYVEWANTEAKRLITSKAAKVKDSTKND